MDKRQMDVRFINPFRLIKHAMCVLGDTKFDVMNAMVMAVSLADHQESRKTTKQLSNFITKWLGGLFKVILSECN
jgi:hypothetical protein